MMGSKAIGAIMAIRALSDKKYDYYRLKKDIGLLKAGAIFYHDPDDNIYGSIAEGCLKLCWTPDGNRYNRLAGGTVIFPYAFTETDLFEKIANISIGEVAYSLDAGRYILDVKSNGAWQLTKTNESVGWYEF